jgi:hypothetical protein
MQGTSASMAVSLHKDRDTMQQDTGAHDDETRQVWKNVMKSFINFPSLFYYCFIVFMCGLLTAFHWSFFFWFLENIQPQDTLLMG